MLENLYTTKMSADKKTLQNRLTKICSKNGRFSRLSAAVISCAVAAVMLVATVVIAAGFNRGKNAVPEHEAAETLQVAEFSPADIKDIKNVELFAGDVRYTLKTTGAQSETEKLISFATAIQGSPGCPFSAKLLFTKNSGEKGIVTLASDSCAIFKSGGKYYKYSDADNSALLGYFGLDAKKLIDLTTSEKVYMKDPETALKSFFAAFDKSDLVKMKALVTNDFIAQGYIGDYGMCFGMTRATLETEAKTNIDEFLKNYFARPKHTQLELSENDIELLRVKSDKLAVYTVTVMAEHNIKGETKPPFRDFFNVICKRQENGSYLVHKLIN